MALKKEELSFTEKAGKWLTKTGLFTAQSIASTADLVIDVALKRLGTGLSKPVSGVFLPKKTEQQIEKTRRGYVDFITANESKLPAEKAKRAIASVQSHQALQPSDEWQQSSLPMKFHPKNIGETVFEVSSGVVGSWIPFMVNPTVGISVAMGATAADVRDKAREYGVSDEAATNLGMTTGALVGLLERVVPDKVLGKNKQKFVGGLANKMIQYAGMAGQEAGTEIAQETVQLLAERTFRDDIKMDEVATRTVMAGFGGLLGGAGMSAAIDFVNSPDTRSQVAEAARKMPIGFTIEEVGEEGFFRRAEDVNKNTDEIRGGTWFTNKAGEKTVTDAMKDFGEIGGEKKFALSKKPTNPLVVENALLGDGSFAVINSGYESFLPAKNLKAAETLYNETVAQAERELSDEQFNELVTGLLLEVGINKKQIQDILVKTKENAGDAAMDAIISSGLKQEGYDALILRSDDAEHALVFDSVKPGKQASSKAKIVSHGTTAKAVDKIKSEGFKVSKSPLGIGVFFTDSAKTQETFGDEASIDIDISDFNLLSVGDQRAEKDILAKYDAKNLNEATENGGFDGFIRENKDPDVGNTYVITNLKKLNKQVQTTKDVKATKPVKSKENVITKTKEVRSVSQAIKDRLVSFFRPSRKQKTRAFTLLGNKDTTIPLFEHIFGGWVKSGVDTIVEPYGGAFTLGTHSLDQAIEAGLKEFHSNIFDKEKYIIVDAIKNGKLEEVEKAVPSVIKEFNQVLLDNADSPVVADTLNGFFRLHPDSYIGSDLWIKYVKNLEIGKQVALFKDDYEAFRKAFQAGYDAFYAKPITDIESAVRNAFIKRIGVFGDAGQKLLTSNGFAGVENKLYGKFGMVEGFKDINASLEKAKSFGTKVFLYNEDGAKNTKRFAKRDPKKLGLYFDPPYVLSSETYAKQLDDAGKAELKKFTDGRMFVDKHLSAFKMARNGARIVLTNDIEQRYIDAVQSKLRDSTLFGYKEGQTPTSLITDPQSAELVTGFLDSKEGKVIDRNEYAIINEIAEDKELSSVTVSRLKKAIGIETMKTASDEQVDELMTIMLGMENGDRLLTDKQKEGLSGLFDLGMFENIDLVTQREVREAIGEDTDILQGRIVSRLSADLFPSVDIKEDHPVITKIINDSDILLRNANKKTEERSVKIDEMMKKAEKSDGSKRYDVNVKIFKAMSGRSVELTAEQRAVVAYLKNFFSKAKKDLRLEKFRTHYIPHIQKQLMERIRTKGVIEAIRSYKDTKSNDIPVDVLIALDHIIGSEKFFRFQLERKGGLDPTMDIRKIVNEYSRILENKKALDKILPGAQAAQQLLLQKRSALWMQKFLQNLKGRGLDSRMRNSEMGWVTKVADRSVDLGYILLLGGNYMSAIKNIIGGEANSFVFQTFDNYVRGKQRLLTSPKAAFRLISDMNILAGSYADLARSDVITKAKRTSDIVLYGGMEAAEYEIRGSYVLGELTAQEWADVKAGKQISDNRRREILDGIAITQGVYTAVDSPLFVQTWYGRAAMQFSRWRITNALLFRRIMNGAKKDIQAGNYNSVNVRRVLKAFMLYGFMMYLSFELGKRGHKKAKRVALAGAEFINNMIDVVSMKFVVDAIKNNPTLERLEEVVYSIQELAAYIGISEEPYKIEVKGGIEDTYISSVKMLQEAFGEEETKPKTKPRTGTKARKQTKPRR